MTQRLAIILSIGLLGWTIPAEAQAPYQAQATASVNVRQGPSTQYRVLATLQPGQTVPVFGCLRGYTWCEVGTPQGSRGWVSARYLTDTQRQAPVSSVGSQLGIALVQFLFNQAGGGPLGGQPPPSNQVCFYGDVNFSGPSFCSGPGGQDDAVPGNWNDRISSIQVGAASGGAYVCRDVSFQGQCDFYSQNVAGLAGSRNDSISSFRIGQDARNGFPPAPPTQAQVCLYQDWDFRGASLCQGAGNQTSSLSVAWNDRISSIRIDPSLWVQVCYDFDYQGQCSSIGDDVRRLSGGANDGISSYRVFAR